MDDFLSKPVDVAVRLARCRPGIAALAVEQGL